MVFCASSDEAICSHFRAGSFTLDAIFVPLPVCPAPDGDIIAMLRTEAIITATTAIIRRMNI
jgi:hypothetical protein